MTTTEHDLAIVGAGTSGATLAVHTARAGLRVVCLDRRRLGDAGARWVNGVPRWMFREAGVAEPRGDECVGGGHPFHLVAGWGPVRVVVHEHDVLEVDMRLLVQRLQRDAASAGADLRGEVMVHGFSSEALSTSAGPLRARFYIDASGLSGARLLGQEAAHPSDLCAAAQDVRALRDPSGARAFLERNGASEGTTLCFSAVAGGYSIVNVRVQADRVSLLTGSIPSRGHPSGARLLSSFVAEQPWIGATLFGGARAIPLMRPRQLARGRVALIGDAGSQVFAAHGSGIGLGLIAARQLADALIRGGCPDDYARAFRQRWGVLLGSYDMFRRLSQRLTARQVAWLMRARIVGAASVRAALEQRLPLSRAPRETG